MLKCQNLFTLIPITYCAYIYFVPKIHLIFFKHANSRETELQVLSDLWRTALMEQQAGKQVHFTQTASRD